MPRGVPDAELEGDRPRQGGADRALGVGDGDRPGPRRSRSQMARKASARSRSPRTDRGSCRSTRSTKCRGSPSASGGVTRKVEVEGVDPGVTRDPLGEQVDPADDVLERTGSRWRRGGGGPPRPRTGSRRRRPRGCRVKLARRWGRWVATPGLQVSRWQARSMMQPSAIIAAVPKLYSSAPSRAASSTWRPVLKPPSTRSRTRPRRPLSTSARWVSARPISHGMPACLMALSGQAPVPPLPPEMWTTSARAFTTPAAMVPTFVVGDQLHRHLGGVDLLEVVDELGQVLDGVDVVVGRRGDEADTGLGVAQPGDLGRHLVARELAALARLGALGHLDLDLVGVGQVLGRDAEAARRDLLDLASSCRRAPGPGCGTDRGPRRPRRSSSARRSGSWPGRGSRGPPSTATRGTWPRWRTVGRSRSPVRPRRAGSAGRPGVHSSRSWSSVGGRSLTSVDEGRRSGRSPRRRWPAGAGGRRPGRRPAGRARRPSASPARG